MNYLSADTSKLADSSIPKTLTPERAVSAFGSFAGLTLLGLVALYFWVKN